MKNLLLAFTILFMFPILGKAQLYEQSIGLRAGFNYGISYKKALGNGKAFEGFATGRRGGVGLTALLEWNRDFFEFERMQWYYGAGVHGGTWLPGASDTVFTNGGSPDRFFAIGIDGIIGIEYSFEEFPISISADLLYPFNLLDNSNNVWRERSALTLRYYF